MEHKDQGNVHNSLYSAFHCSAIKKEIKGLFVQEQYYVGTTCNC